MASSLIVLGGFLTIFVINACMYGQSGSTQARVCHPVWQYGQSGSTQARVCHPVNLPGSPELDL
jgi:hypothetical protein